MKKVLIIAIDFPPHSSVGRHRVVRFTKHLRMFGWRPFVLTRTATYMWDRDPETLLEVPKDISVYRAFYPDFVQILASLFSKKGKGRDIRQVRAEKPKGDKSNLEFLKKSIVKLVNSYNTFKRKYILIPDEYIVWLPFALIKALKILRAEKIDIIFTTAPPHALTIVGRLLKLITKKPWIADYRDLWTGDHSRMWINKPRLKLEEIMEKKVVSQADGIISVSSQKVDILEKKLATLEADRFHLITNGFEAEDFPEHQDKYKELGKFTITFTGRLYKKISGIYFFRSLGELVKEKPILKNKIRVRFFGNIAQDEKKRLDPILKEYNLSPIVRFTSYVPHNEAMRYQVASDLLILFVGFSDNCDGIIPTKLFEYFGAGRPIMAMVPKGATWDLVTESKTGIAVEPENIQGIKNGLWTFFQKYENKQLKLEPNKEVLSQFDGKVLTRKLAKVFDGLYEV